MKIKDIISLASALLRTDFESEGETELLVRLCNMIISEVASEYIALPASEKRTVKESRLYYKDLALSPVDIKTITTLGGQKQSFKIYPSYLETENGEVIIDYTYLPKPLSIDDEIEFFGGKVRVSTFAYGVLAEYCLINGQFDEARAFDSKYRTALTASARKNTEQSIKKRTWA